MDDNTHYEGSVDVGVPVCMCFTPFWVWEWSINFGRLDLLWWIRR